MLDKWPKIRPKLPKEYKDIYEKTYRDNREGNTVASSVSKKMERWLHTQVAKDSDPLLTSLEIGAGTLNQLEFEKLGGGYDIVEPFKVLYENSDKLFYIRNVYNLIEDIPLTCGYDRIISCASLEHIDNLPVVISKSGLLLKETGCFRASVPSHGGFLWKMGYTFTTGLEFRIRYNLDYSIIMNHEHINTVDEIEELIRWFYRDVKLKRLGITKHFSFYTYIEAKNPNVNRCEEYYSVYGNKHF